MIGSATLDYTKFEQAFHNTLATDCKSELEKISQIKQRPYVTQNAENSWIYKNLKWKWIFGGERQTEHTYKLLKLLFPKLIQAKQTQLDKPIKLHYVARPESEAEKGIVYIPNEEFMPEIHSGIDAEMFDVVILPCLRKTLNQFKLDIDVPVGKVSTLEVYETQQISLGKYENMPRELSTVEVTAKVQVKDGFTKVNRSDKKILQIASSKGVNQESPEYLKIVQIWCRQHGEALPEHVEQSITELKIT